MSKCLCWREKSEVIYKIISVLISKLYDLIYFIRTMLYIITGSGFEALKLIFKHFKVII